VKWGGSRGQRDAYRAARPRGAAARVRDGGSLLRAGPVRVVFRPVVDIACVSVTDERHDAVRLQLERFRMGAEVVVDMWDEARDEREGFYLSLDRAIWIYGTCRDRDARLLPTLATKLVEAIGFAALALAVAVADEL